MCLVTCIFFFDIESYGFIVVDDLGFFVGFFFFESLCALEDECLLVLNVIVLYNLLLVTM